MNVAINGPEILGYLFGNTSLPITETMRNSWIIMAFILFLCIFLTRRMEKIPKGKQAFAEKAVLMIDGLVDSTMGEGCRAFSPYIMTLMMSSLFGSLASLFWMRSTTADLNTTLGWAIITFILITYNKIKFGGIKGYLKGFLEPIFCHGASERRARSRPRSPCRSVTSATWQAAWSSRPLSWARSRSCRTRFWASCRSAASDRPSGRSVAVF